MSLRGQTCVGRMPCLYSFLSLLLKSERLNWTENVLHYYSNFPGSAQSIIFWGDVIKSMLFFLTVSRFFLRNLCMRSSVVNKKTAGVPFFCRRCFYKEV